MPKYSNYGKYAAYAYGGAKMINAWSHRRYMARANRRRYGQRNRYRARWGTVVPRGMRGRYRTGGYYGRYNHSHQPAELKFHDVAISFVPTTVAGQIAGSLNIIPQGDGESERIGRQITIKSISCRYIITLPETITLDESCDTVRIMLILDQQTNGAQAPLLDVLELAEIRSYRNLSNVNRFKVLYDKKTSVSAMASTGSSSLCVERWGNFHWKGAVRINYNPSATTGAITTIESNNFFLLVVSDKGLLEFRSLWRVRFEG